VTDTQQSVFVALQRLPAGTWQQPPESEQLTADGAFSIDIAATTAGGAKVAIEVDGPTHFIQPGRTPDGTTQFRDRALAARGYVVVSIPYWEWDALRDATRQQQYLLTKLQPAVQPLG
jgi:very-short-patch-repair endonuclease